MKKNIYMVLLAASYFFCVIVGSPHGVDVFVSSEDNLKKEFIELVRAEKSGIFLAAYLLIDPDVTQALLEAAARQVKVEVVVDQLSFRWGKKRIESLLAADIPVHIYVPQGNKHPRNQPIMHNKFCVFCNNKGNESAVWTGSFNFTKKAAEKNLENAVLVRCAAAVRKYMRYFYRLARL